MPILGGLSSATASNLVSVADYGTVGDNVADDTAALQAAINAAVTQNRELYIGPGTYRVSSALTMTNNNIRITGAGVQRTKIRASVAGFDVLTIGNIAGANGAHGFNNGRIKDLSIQGAGIAANGFAALKLNTTLQYEVSNLQLSDADIGFDMVNNCYGTICSNLRIGFGATVNVGINLRTGQQSGSDMVFTNMWVTGMQAAVHVSGGGGGYHFFGGQLSAGQGTNNTAQDAWGTITIGKDYTSQVAGNGAASIDLHGVSFEGSNYVWLIRGYDYCEVALHGCALNGINNPQQTIGIYKNLNHKGSRLLLSGCAVGGLFSGPSLVVYNLGGTYGQTWLTELNNYTPPGGLSVAGVTSDTASIARQSNMLEWAVVQEPRGMTANGVGLTAPVRNLLTPNEAAATVDTAGLFSTGNATMAREVVNVPEPGQDVSCFSAVAVAAGNISISFARKAVTAGLTYRGSVLMLPDVAASAHPTQIVLTWLTAAGAVISSTTTDFLNENGLEWKLYSLSGTAPATAALGQIGITIGGAALGEKHYLARALFGRVSLSGG